jgi:hypothetical protein
MELPQNYDVRKSWSAPALPAIYGIVVFTGMTACKAGCRNLLPPFAVSLV